MRRAGPGPVWAALLGSVAGVALQVQQAELWPAWCYAVLLVAGLALVWPWRRRWWLGVALTVALFAWTGWRAALYQAGALPPELEGMDLQLQGQVADLPQWGETGWQFEFEVESALQDDRTVALPQRLRLHWGSGFGDLAGHSAQERGLPELRAGQRWRFTVRLRAPHGLANPHGFDAELWLWEQKLRATGNVRQGKRDPAPLLLEQTWHHPLAQLRQTVRSAIFARVADPRTAGLIAALVLGDQTALGPEDWDIFRRTGVAHLVSVSGTHITMFAALAVVLVGWAWRQTARWWPGLLWRVPAPVAAQAGGVLLATAYALFAGWGVPAQRTVIMLAVVLGLRLVGRRWPWPVVWLAAMNAVLLIDPWALLQPGFWLSFVAVGVLFASSGAEAPARRWHHRVRDLLRTQGVITLALAPLSLLLFGQFSLVGVLANLLAIPLVGGLLTPLTLAGVVCPPLWQLADWGLAAWLHSLEWMATWPGGVLERPALPWGLALLAVAGGVLLVLRLPWGARLCGLGLLWPALVFVPPRPAPGTFELLAADVGQGNAVLLRTAGHTLLYDTGPQMGSQSDAGQRVLVPLLRAGGDRLDALVLSHDDNDHTGGVRSVLLAQPQTTLWASFDTVPALGLAARRCEAGQRWAWDGVTFEFLHPLPEDAARELPDNARSCVLRVSAGGRSALLTGDLPAAEEKRVLAAYPGLHADWLLAAHHGSKTSSDPAWLRAVQPRWTVIQSGYRNRYRHPAPEVLARYDALGLPWVSSPACGAATWHSAAPDVLLCERQVAPRYWQHRLDSRPAAGDKNPQRLRAVAAGGVGKTGAGDAPD